MSTKTDADAAVQGADPGFLQMGVGMNKLRRYGAP